MIRRAFATVREVLAAVARPFVPEPGTTEGAVMLGLVLLAVGFVLADLAPLALLVPGAVLVILGSLPALRARS